jgi:hypothetical protein
LLHGRWFDLPTDLRLSQVDRYATSRQAQYTRTEVNQQWQLSVRQKLLMGEVGWMRKFQFYNNHNNNTTTFMSDRTGTASVTPTATNIPHNPPPGIPPLWRLSIHGGIVKLTHGVAKTVGGGGGSRSNSSGSGSGSRSSAILVDHSSSLYHPITALLTVMSSAEETNPEWTLLSLEVHVQAKTGEFNHQLETSNRQRYDLHRLAALAMSREEARARRARMMLQQQQQHDAVENNNHNTMDSSITMHHEHQQHPDELIPRPLHALFQVAHTFSLSWQLELLSAQAQSLRRGAWAAAGDDTNPITVTPVRFADSASNSAGSGSASTASDSDNEVLGVVDIAFWKVDDSYGPPSMGDLTLDENDNGSYENEKHQQKQQTNITSSGSTMTRGSKMTTATNQLVLSIRAETNGGMKVALSGGGMIRQMMAMHPHIQATTRELLAATSNPLALSASDALLAATRLCAERKCHAAVQALQPESSQTPPIVSSSLSSSTAPSLTKLQHHEPLPGWIFLSVERGSISIAARVSYYGLEEEGVASSASGETTNSKGMPVLFRLCCDARTGSFVATFPRSTALLRMLAGNDGQASEAMALRIASLPPNRRRAAGGNSSGRIVRDTFDGLIRSMNVLGQRVGVGGKWDDVDEKSSSIRERSIFSACKDVRVALVKCCGIAALYGLAPLAFGTAFGLQAMADMAGEPLPSSKDSDHGLSLFPAPPVSILLDQRLVDTSTTTSDGVTKRGSYLEQNLFAVACCANESTLTLVPFDILAKRDSPMATTQRLKHTLLEFKKDSPLSSLERGERENDGQEPPLKRPKQENGGNAYSIIHSNRQERWAEDLIVEVERFANILGSTVDQ